MGTIGPINDLVFGRVDQNVVRTCSSRKKSGLEKSKGRRELKREKTRFGALD